ncbi:MAG: SMP-30/gluconolactonase/LRE family protein [Actinobacteria bacterium]|nr:SMP-30/gluconolactonase/LRE family protein [Actinomycetota bacterium]
MARVFAGEVSVYVAGTQFAEGPAFDAEGRLYITDGKSAALWRVEHDGTLKVFARPKGPNGSAFHWNGDCYVTDPRGNRIARVTPDGQVYTVCDTCDGQPVGTPNDLTFHPSGALYFSSPVGPHNDPNCPPRPVYRIGADGVVSKVVDGIRYPNGVNVNADGSVLYVAESHTGQVHRFEIRPDGSVGDGRVLADVREGQDNWWAPDGMCLDIEGNLYVACYSGGRVRRIRPDGAIDLDILVPGPNTTNCCFGGKDNAELFITEGRDGTVYRAAVGIPGLPLFGPRGWRNTAPA